MCVYIYIYIDMCIHIYIALSLSLYIYIYIYMYVRVIIFRIPQVTAPKAGKSSDIYFEMNVEKPRTYITIMIIYIYIYIHTYIYTYIYIYICIANTIKCLEGGHVFWVAPSGGRDRKTSPTKDTAEP